MIKLQLIGNSIVFEILSDTKKDKIVINNGVYNGKKYDYVVFANGSIVLEGEENTLLERSYKAVYITIKSILDKIADILQNDDVYLSGIDSIPTGAERELIEKLLIK